jgi:hypothetical protein
LTGSPTATFVAAGSSPTDGLRVHGPFAIFAKVVREAGQPSAVRRQPIRTRKRAIAEYWLEVPEGRKRLPDNKAGIDVGEPSCFACGWMATDPDEPPEIWGVWERAALDRCHLVPHALGGLDVPQNLVLLCGRCHAEAPDVGAPEYMLRWIDAHDCWGNLLQREMKAALELHGIEEREIETFNALGLAPLLNMGDLMKKWSVPVASRFSYATLAACAIETLRRSLAGDPAMLRERSGRGTGQVP